MKTASMVLGIVGGIIAILTAIGCFIGSAVVTDVREADWGEWESDWEITIDGETYNSEFDIDMNDSHFRRAAAVGTRMLSNMLLAFGIMHAIGGILAIVGGAIVRRSNIGGSVMLLIGALTGFAAFILLLIGAILGFVRDNPPYVQAPPPPASM